MGLASALTTALTGLSAAETQIDVVGNNLANSQTVGFKASDVVFVTQFLQTQSLGSSPTSSDGGTNPRQTGLGVRTAEITPDFTQGTVEVSSNPSDLAIQGDGFFKVQGTGNEVLYTRNGIFKTNAENELVTTTGNRVLGYGVDKQYLPTKEVSAIKIPLGQKVVAQATKNVTLEGVLTPTGDVANQAEVIDSAILGDGNFGRPAVTGSNAIAATRLNVSGVSVGPPSEVLGGDLAEGSVYRYKFSYVDSAGKETQASDELTVTVPAGDSAPNNSVVLSNLPAIPTGYSSINVYRTAAGGSTYFQHATGVTGTTYTDSTAADTTTQLNNTTLSGNYSYLVTFFNPTSGSETRPSELLGPVNVVNGRIQLSNLPSSGAPSGYTQMRIYRNLATNASDFRRVATTSLGVNYTDNASDAALATAEALDFEGPPIQANTLLTNVLKRDGLNYEKVFTEGTLKFEARKGGRQLEPREFKITDKSTVGDLIGFMRDAMGIQTTSNDPEIPTSINSIVGETAPLGAGAYVTADGKIRFVSNNGVDNGVEIALGSFVLTDATNNVATPNLSFTSAQSAKGQSAVADFIVYDSTGVGLNVRVTTVLESVNDTATTYRWFADSPQNETTDDPNWKIAVGTGLVSFDGEGNLIGDPKATVAVQRRDSPATDPLQFKLNFNNVSGLAASKASLAASRQDGSASGSLSSFIVGEDGKIRGVFTNGSTRDLGKLELARFANPSGLEQVGQSMFRQSVNSGEPLPGSPGQNGIGKIIAGARELSNTDIGKNLIDLVLATTQYRGNSRVISTAQQLLDELLNLRR